MDTKKKIILIADEGKNNRAVLRELLCDSYTVLEAENKEAVIQTLNVHRRDITILLLDMVAENLEGLQILKLMNETNQHKSIQVIMLVSDESAQIAREGFRLGAAEAIMKPFYPEIVRRRVANVVSLYANQQEGKKYRILAELSGEIIFNYDVENDIMEFSGRKPNYFYCEKRISNYQQFFEKADPIHPEDKDKVTVLTESGEDEEDYSSVEVRLLTKSGKYEWFSIQAHAMRQSDEAAKAVVYIGKITNIHQQRVEKERLRLEADTDTLTGLLNHKAAKRMIRRYIKEEGNGRAALIFIDVDNFKNVNDNFGHSIGDEVLESIGNKLKLNFRNSDVIARIGGDEFVVFAKDFESEEVLRKRVQDLLSAVGEMNVARKWEYKVFVSIGVAYFPSNGNSYEELFRRADKALYSSKDKGKNQITFFDPSLETAMQMPELSEIDGALIRNEICLDI